MQFRRALAGDRGKSELKGMAMGTRSHELKGPRGKRKQHPRGQNDLAYEFLGKRKIGFDI